MLSKTIIGNVRAGERVAISVLQSNYSLFTIVFELFLLTEIGTMKVFPRDFIVILNHRSYFVFLWILYQNKCTCNYYEYA